MNDMQKFLTQIDDSKKLINFFEFVKPYYNDKKNFDHNLNHITQCLNSLKKISHHISQNDLFCLAFSIIGHDVIMKKEDNLTPEELSANLTDKWCIENNLNSLDVKKIKNCILATQHFKKTQDMSEIEKMMVSIDLLILANENYDSYKNSIRKEYDYVPETMYKMGRKKALNDLLKKDIIFPHPLFSKFEEQARNNLRKEIQSMSKKLN